MLVDNGRRVKQYYNYHITKEELKIVIKYVRQHCDTKYEIAISLMAFRGLRPSEALATNIYDFSRDYTRLTFREAKTNRIRENKVIVKPLAERIKTYVSLNKHRLKDGWLFPFYNRKLKKRNGKIIFSPYMSSQTFAVWFNVIRYRLAKIYPSFNEKYSFKLSNGNKKWVYRIHPYSFRRFFETRIYIKNKYNIALVKEIMEYSSSFDPMKSYIKIIHREAQKEKILENTFSELSREIFTGQKTLGEFV